MHDYTPPVVLANHVIYAGLSSLAKERRVCTIIMTEIERFDIPIRNIQVPYDGDSEVLRPSADVGLTFSSCKW